MSKHFSLPAVLSAVMAVLMVSGAGGEEPSGDSAQWGGSPSRNNVRGAVGIPDEWRVGDFYADTGDWDPSKAKNPQSQVKNIKWCAEIGSQTYGNPVVAGGKVFVGTNNGAGRLKRYPPEVDLGCLLCFRESDGMFLWQHSSKKLASGRTHDWPLQGVCSAPVVEGDRLWFVTNRGEVVCLDTEGFRDGDDDGPVTGVSDRMFEVVPNLGGLAERNRAGMSMAYRSTLLPIVAQGGMKNESYIQFEPVGPGRWSGSTGGRFPKRLFEMVLEQGSLRITGVDRHAGKEIEVGLDLLAGLDQGRMSRSLRAQFQSLGIDLPADVRPAISELGKSWIVVAGLVGAPVEYRLVLEGPKLVCYRTITPALQDEADVAWSFDMMKELGVSQHNMATCSPTIAGDTLFICTSNGVDESHIHIPAPDAPSFIALDKRTGKVLWTDRSPGKNILHGQWSSPAYAVLGGRPQVLFAGGDGWLYSFDPAGDGRGGSRLLWKFDCNPKHSEYILGGRGTRNEIVGFPMIYDGLVYIAVGQDPEHGEGIGHLWCVDPTKHGDVSPELAFRLPDLVNPIAHRKLQAVIAADGEVARPNPNSALVWHYGECDLDGNGKIDFEESMHRSISTPVIKDDLLYISDFSGLFHCLDAKTGVLYWTQDLFAACWSSALVAGDRVYIGDEDGKITIFRHGSRREVLNEVEMGNSIYMTPVVANKVLFITNKTHLFAIASERPQ